ncbi:MAG TPA: choice-of-anchor tandem repeat NxxGxxAF-containing protein [Candidatus Limnocylindria bacterium]|nr:choice-of-anchor tandem repeat NxxGxxAF-containing protein [Candidatus Limnocylindria bacterium]
MGRAVAGLLALALLGATDVVRAEPEVVLRSGMISPGGLPYSRFVGIGLGDEQGLAVLASTTAVFRAVRVGGVARAERVFAPGDQLDGRTVIGADAPAIALDGCVVARLGFADGGAAIYRRCGALVQRVAGVGDTVGTHTVRQIDPTVVTAGGFVAFLARLSDGQTAVIRGGSGPLVEIARTGQSSPAGGTFSSLRLIGVRTSGVVGFGATVADGRDGLFEGEGSGLRKVVVEGDGTQDGTIEVVDGASMNRAGVFAFLGTFDGIDGTARGIFRADARPPLPQVALVVKVGDAVPGVSGGTFARFVPSTVPVIGATGDVAFRVTLGGNATGAGVFVAHTDGTVTKVVTTREEVEVDVGGVGEEDTLTRLRDPALADDGSVLVVAAPPKEGVGLFVARAGAIAELIRFGAEADIGAADQRFRFVSPSVPDRAEDAVFLGQHDVLLSVDGSGGVRLVTQLGAAGPLGGRFSEIDLPAVTADGRVAFRGELLAGKTGQAIFIDAGPGKLPSPLAKAGRAAPGPGRFRDFPPTVGDGGGSVAVAGTRVAFLASLSGGNAFEGTFLARPRGGGSSLVRVNKRAPGGGRYVSVDLPSVLDREHYAYTALVRDDATRQALFWRDGRKKRIVARQGLETGVRLGGRFQAFAPPSLAAGGLVFRAEVSPNGRAQLFIAVDTRRGLLVAAGDPADEGGTFRTFDRPVWAGDSIVFTGALAGLPSLRGLFTLTPDGVPMPDAPPRPVTTLLREGRPAPEGGAIVDVRPPVGNVRGDVASIVRVEGGPAEQLVVRLELDAPTSP